MRDLQTVLSEHKSTSRTGNEEFCKCSLAEEGSKMMLDDQLARAVLTAIYMDDDHGVTGYVEEFIGVSAHGKNLKEARARLTAAARIFLEEHRDDLRQRMALEGTFMRERLLIDVRT
jgi:predicted RNase H-like HicB family nuclease